MVERKKEDNKNYEDVTDSQFSTEHQFKKVVQRDILYEHH